MKYAPFNSHQLVFFVEEFGSRGGIGHEEAITLVLAMLKDKINILNYSQNGDGNTNGDETKEEEDNLYRVSGHFSREVYS